MFFDDLESAEAGIKQLEEAQVSTLYLRTMVDMARKTVGEMVDRLPPGKSRDVMEREFGHCFDDFVLPLVEKARIASGVPGRENDDELFPAIEFFHLLAESHFALPIAVEKLMANEPETARTAAVMIGRLALASTGKVLLVDMGIIEGGPCPHCGEEHP